MKKHKPTTRSSKFSNKRSAAQIAADAVEIAQLVLTGHTELEIAHALSAKRNYSLSRSQVHLDVVSLRERWAESADMDTRERINEELARLGHIEKTAWKRFDDTGEPGWMNAILRVIGQRVSLLGLSKPTMLEFSAPDGGPIAILQVPERGTLDRDA